MRLRHLKKYMTAFRAAAPLPEQFRPLRRIQRYFAVLYASAAQAIDYGILPWKKKPTLKAIKACMNDAMDQLGGNGSDTSAGTDRSDSSSRLDPADDDLLAEFSRRVAQANFVRVGRGRDQRPTADQLNAADVFIRPTEPGRVKHFLRSDLLEAWFPVAAERKRLSAALIARRIVRPGPREDSATRQVMFSPIGKVSCYQLVRRRITA